MSYMKKLDRVFEQAKRIQINENSKFIIMSDCHRGDGSWADNFAKNQNLFFAALNRYYEEGYSYIEVGDGDELWENKDMSEIIDIHSNTFWLMSKFYRECRLHLIYGNHDMEKKYRCMAKNCNRYYDTREQCNLPLFPNISFEEGIVLEDKRIGIEILLTHGHQVDFLNSVLWRLARFLVRFLWKPVELLGINDPTSTAKNYKKKKRVERRLTEWSKTRDKLIITGHTHRPIFPKPKEGKYFNDGSCVHPRCITGIEIANQCIRLVKWTNMTRADGTLYVGREELEGPYRLKLY